MGGRGAYGDGVNPVADRVEDITPAWLSRVLGREVRAVTAERIGTGQTGVTYRLVLDADGEPATLVAKLAARDTAARRRVAAAHRNEVGFYRHVAATVDVRTARCWYAALAEDGTAFTLLLDDLAPRVPGVQADGCSRAHAAAAVANLAALHAPRWADESLFDLPFVARPTAEGAAFVGQMAVAACDRFVERYHDELDAADRETLRQAAAATEAWQMARPTPFAVLHGDYRLDNLLFSADGDEVVAVDWQTAVVGPPGRDLAYFLGTSLEVDERRAAEDDLVAAYHAALVARGVEGYEPARCVEDYRLGQLQGTFITTVGAIFATGERSGPVDAMFLAMARRATAAVRDLDTLALVEASASSPG